MHHLEVIGARVKDYVTAVVLSMWLPHNYSITVARKKRKVERSRWWSIGLWAPYKGWPLHMTLYSMTFNHSMTVSFVLYIFEHQLKAFPGSFEEIDLVMEWWERHRIAIYTLRSTIFFTLLVKMELFPFSLLIFHQWANFYLFPSLFIFLIHWCKRSAELRI